jgi:protein required for attachment to host cells
VLSLCLKVLGHHCDMHVSNCTEYVCDADRVRLTMNAGSFPPETNMIAVLVADQYKGAIYLTPHLGAPLEQVAVHLNPDARVHERDLGSGAPGSVVNRMAGIHQAFSPHRNFKQQALMNFGRTLDGQLKQMLDQHLCDSVVLVAAHRTLSALRKALPRAVRDRVDAEISADWAHYSPQVLRQRLAAQRPALLWRSLHRHGALRLH